MRETIFRRGYYKCSCGRYDTKVLTQKELQNFLQKITYCTNCGKGINWIIEPLYFCPDCQEIYKHNENYCSECGVKLVKKEK